MLLWLAQIGVLVMTIVTGAGAGEPPRGSPERAAVLDALRPTAERDLGPPVAFRIERMNVEGAWAFVSATPTRNGKPVDWSRTRFARLIAQDAMSDAILALLRRTADGSWQVVEYALGPTDVTWEEWIAKHRLPRRFFLGEDDAPTIAKPTTTTQGGDPPTGDVLRALDEALGTQPTGSDVAEAPALRNLALGRPAAQSSVYRGTGVDQGAQHAVDGVTAGRDPHDLVLTNTEAMPWWSVDLGGTANIRHIRLFNRTNPDVQSSRMIVVSVGDDGRGFEAVYVHDGQPWTVLDVPVETSGRFVRVHLSNRDGLQLYEVEVWGTM